MLQSTSISHVSLKAYLNATNSERTKLANMLVEWEGYVSDDVQEKMVKGKMWYMFRLIETLPEKDVFHPESLGDPNVECYFDHKQKKHLATLKGGSPVKVTGLIARKDSFTHYSSLLNATDVINCTLLINEQPSRKQGNDSIPSTTKNSDIDVLVASLKNMSSDSYASASVISGISNLNRRITGSEFARILKAANIGSDNYCTHAIVTCSKLLREPVTDKDVANILESISNDSYHAKAANALMTAIKSIRRPARE